MGPWARQRIGTSFEALRAGPWASQRIGTSSEALHAGPRASQRIGTSSEALWRGASGESENRYLVRGLVARGLGRVGESIPRPRPCGVGPRSSPDICSRWAGRSSRASDVAGLPVVVFWFHYLQGLSNFFWFLLRVPLFMVSDSSPQALWGSASTFPEGLSRLGLQLLPSGFLFFEVPVGARERTRRV